MRSDIPIQTSSIIPKKRSLRRFELSTGAEMGRKTAFLGWICRGRRNGGPNRRGEPAGRALYRRRGRSPRPTAGWMSARTLHSLLAALLTLPRQWTYPPRPAGSTRSAVERRPYRKNKKQLEQLFYGGQHARRFKTPRGCAAI